MKKVYLKRKPKKAKETPIQEVAVSVDNNQLDNEIAAVISLALYQYNMKIREDENAIITIQKMMKPYSPWSSKIYGLRERPMRIPGYRNKL